MLLDGGMDKKYTAPYLVILLDSAADLYRTMLSEFSFPLSLQGQDRCIAIRCETVDMSHFSFIRLKTLKEDHSPGLDIQIPQGGVMMIIKPGKDEEIGFLAGAKR
ncbi:MAG: hypothetical protein EOP87_26625 [Verrucomicrobiaceae bacterium]|nr:MAG: hypothetical protein EOP87_26625 [Verrucomicrobiaceae bacterium]